MKKIIRIVSALALSSFTQQVFTSNEPCLEGSNDCNLVKLSHKTLLY
ncbi:hypothetical protein [Colwellia psychrerythraea]|nr:hypothetical protein [Colwellia psychrerythraea]